MEGIKVIFIILLILGMFVFVAAETSFDEHLNTLIENQGVVRGSITNITEVDKTNLPSSVVISNIGDSNIGIYDVEYIDESQNKTLYVISFATEILEESPLVTYRNIQYLNFDGDSDFVVMDDGSITGLSTFAKISGEGNVVVEIYVNSELAFVSNEIYSSGDSYDYEIQSSGIDLFSVGDVVSIKFVENGNINIEEVNSIVKFEL